MKDLYLLLLLITALFPAIYAHSSHFSNDWSIQTATGDTTYRIISSSGDTYGYDILVKGRLLVHQPTIPGMPGNKGFARKSDAEKTARLVIKKIQMGIMPPTIERRELDSLRIKF
ncbi:MAG: DUF4907 domain-containing protein [Ferruginibacter sp.]